MQLDYAVGYQLTLSGSTCAPLAILPTLVGMDAACNLSGTNGQAYIATLTIDPSTTVTLDLTSGLENPLCDEITGANAFAHVYAVTIQHSIDSLASGITAFGAGGSDFQGWFQATSLLEAMPPGGFLSMGQVDSETGMEVSGAQKEIAITNEDAVNDATVIVWIFGIKT